MKISITLTIDVDPDEWADNYGIEKSEVREDVKTYVRTAVQQAPGMQDVDAEVRIR